ncbi:MAG: hypothetical protein H0V19_09820 [Euzebyales bacterium]|nr:hypothetical protein [Euzebyales bacterium]
MTVDWWQVLPGLGGLIVVATLVWAVRDHVADGHHSYTAPPIVLLGAVGAVLLVATLALVAALIALALVGVTVGEWFPLDLSV